MTEPKRIGAVGHGVVEFRGARSYMVGPSGIKHYFDRDDDADRQAAMLGARSQCQPLPIGITPKIVAPGVLALVAHDEEFWVSDNVGSFTEARKQAVEFLSRTRPARAKRDTKGQGRT